MKVHHDGGLLRRVCGWMEHAGRRAGLAVLPRLLYRNGLVLLLLLLLRECGVGKILILPRGSVHNRSVSLPPLPACWRTAETNPNVTAMLSTLNICKYLQMPDKLKMQGHNLLCRQKRGGLIDRSLTRIRSCFCTICHHHT